MSNYQKRSISSRNSLKQFKSKVAQCRDMIGLLCKRPLHKTDKKITLQCELLNMFNFIYISCKHIIYSQTVPEYEINKRIA